MNGKEHLWHVVEHLAHLLPDQGPIGVFIHHNTLHAFQHLPFERAVLEASRLFGTEPYWPESRFRRELSRGRIREEDLTEMLTGHADVEIVPGLRRRALWLAMLSPGVRVFDAAGVTWRMEEGDLARDWRNPALRELFDACAARTEAPETRRAAARPLDEVVHPWLIRLASVYLDQGLSYWPMPDRERGFYTAVRTLLEQPGFLLPSELRGLDEEFRAQAARQAVAGDVVAGWLGPDENQWEERLRDELLALPGWAGLFSKLEREPGLFPHQQLPCTLMDFLAVRLTLASVASRHVAPAPDDEEEEDIEAARLARAAHLYDAARLAGFNGEAVREWASPRWRRFVEEVEAFDALERRRVYQLAFERRHELEVLRGLDAHRRSATGMRRMRPAAQVFFCIDEREESMRRALEEVDPLVETFGAAGFYGVAVDYKGIDDARGSALCPVVVKPQHAVRELPAAEDSHLHEKRVFRRRLMALAAHHASASSKSLVRGALATAALGTLSSIPLITRVLAPRQYGKLRDALNRAFLPEPRTELTLMREGAGANETVEGLLLGFSVTEKADRVASVLVPAGLTGGFARLVVVLGHGSTSLNNPHESAYDCGACGGRRGGPNARLFAMMANRPPIREELARRGILIPADTWFIGGDHDTCSDDVELFDLDAVPPTHADALRSLRESLDRARARNARERTRRFESCPDEVTPEAALHHVEERSEHLAEPRQECGHATNAVCIVGRRAWTRNLFLDRRAFLVSYDPLQDADGASLARLMGAVVPVCAGINLEYYFSCVDNQKYGCGTKLPHNVTSLMGVMDGQGSDLRTGLPLQMVEIHEPVRCLFVVEAGPQRLERVIEDNPIVAEFVENRWIRMAIMDPDTGRIRVRHGKNVYEDLPGEPAQLPEVPDWHSWYKGKLDHLPLAALRPDPAERMAAR